MPFGSLQSGIARMPNREAWAEYDKHVQEYRKNSVKVFRAAVAGRVVNPSRQASPPINTMRRTASKNKSMGGPFGIIVDGYFDDLLRLHAGLGTIIHAMTDRAVLTGPALVFGNQTLDNFNNEGPNWPSLSGMTQEKRKQRGLNPQHPILVQSGWLANASTEPFLRFGGHAGTGRVRAINPVNSVPFTSWMSSDDNPEGVSTASFTVSTAPLSITAKIRGPKAEHQVRTKVEGKGSYRGKKGRFQSRYIPPRPFWRLTLENIDDMRESVKQLIIMRWAFADSAAVVSGDFYQPQHSYRALVKRKVSKQRKQKRTWKKYSTDSSKS